jgi:outer membrane protein assembly factor BamB
MIYVYERGYKSQLYCLDADTGEDIWEYTVKSWATGHSPAVKDDKIYFGTGHVEESVEELIYSGDVVCLNTLTGEKIWNYTTDDYIRAAPTLANGRLYVGSEDHNVYCFDADPFDDGIDEGYDDPSGVDYDLIWSFDTGCSIHKTPAVSEGRVYVVVYRCVGGTLFCLDASTGEEIWHYGYESIISSPVVVDGKVYLGGTYGDPIEGGRVVCIDAVVPNVVYWEYTIPCYLVYATPAVAYGRVYIACENKILYCFDAENGDILWEKHNIALRTTPAIADGKVYMFSMYNMGSGDGDLFCFDAFNGDLLWKHELVKGYAEGGSSPAIANGKIHIAVTEKTSAKWCIHTFEEGQNQPPETPKITGPTTGKIMEVLHYVLSTNDSDNNGVYYYVDWGDGSTYEPNSMNNSGDELTVIHLYLKKGTYKIRVKAIDVNNAESDWSEPLKVEITRRKSKSFDLLNFNFLQKLLEQHLNLFPILRYLL